MTELGNFSVEEPYHVVVDWDWHWGQLQAPGIHTAHRVCDQAYFLGRRAVGRRPFVSTLAMPAPEVAFYSDAHYIIFGETPVSDKESNYLYEISGSVPDHDL